MSTRSLLAGSIRNLFLGPRPDVLMRHGDPCAGRSAEKLPAINMPMKRRERRRDLAAEEYMSAKLVDALESRVDWEGKHAEQNRRYFEEFARELHSFQLRNDDFEVLAHKKTFLLHNLTRDYEYRQAF